jgi:hypothetical protein
MSGDILAWQQLLRPVRIGRGIRERTASLGGRRKVTTQGRGPLNDPRLTERRGDLSGLNAALFVILVIVAFVAAAVLLATVLHIGGPSATPTPPPSAAVSPSASATARSSPKSSAVPSPSRLPTPSAVASAALGMPLNVVVGGHVIGTVTVISVQYPPTVAGNAPGTGVRWFAARVRYQAKARLAYDSSDWSIVDAAGTQYAWAGVDLKPPLGKGALKIGEKAGGNVTFKVPTQGTLWLVFSRGDAQLRVQLPAQ